jgi:hypothetical protein
MVSLADNDGVVQCKRQRKGYVDWDGPKNSIVLA